MGKDNSLVYQKAFGFAVKIVKLYQHLNHTQHETVLSRQVLRSGTSIAANIREALNGQSKRDFIAKMAIALKEAGETEYWLELFIASELLKQSEIEVLQTELKEIIKILNSIIISTKTNLSQEK